MNERLRLAAEGFDIPEIIIQQISSTAEQLRTNGVENPEMVALDNYIRKSEEELAEVMEKAAVALAAVQPETRIMSNGSTAYVFRTENILLKSGPGIQWDNPTGYWIEGKAGGAFDGCRLYVVPPAKIAKSLPTAPNREKKGWTKKTDDINEREQESQSSKEAQQTSPADKPQNATKKDTRPVSTSFWKVKHPDGSVWDYHLSPSGSLTQHKEREFRIPVFTLAEWQKLHQKHIADTTKKPVSSDSITKAQIEKANDVLDCLSTSSGLSPSLEKAILKRARKARSRIATKKRRTISAKPIKQETTAMNEIKKSEQAPRQKWGVMPSLKEISAMRVAAAQPPAQKPSMPIVKVGKMTVQQIQEHRLFEARTKAAALPEKQAIESAANTASWI